MNGGILPPRSYQFPAIAISLLVHAAVVVALIATGGLQARRIAPPDRVIDIVSLQNFLPAPPPAAVAAPPPLSPPPPPPPSVDAPTAPVDQTLLHENLAPADEGSSGMSVATDAPRPAAPTTDSKAGGEEYVPQFRITEKPVFPEKEILSKIEYPPLAAKQGIEAIVYLELYIDRSGKIVRANVLKDPGFGFADAAVKVLLGVICTPAKMDGQPVAVRFRYPVRFTLK